MKEVVLVDCFGDDDNGDEDDAGVSEVDAGAGAGEATGRTDSSVRVPRSATSMSVVLDHGEHGTINVGAERVM